MFILFLAIIFLYFINLLFSFVQNTTAQAALQAAQGVLGDGASRDRSPILRVIVDNVLYPVTLDVLHKVSILFSEQIYLV